MNELTLNDLDMGNCLPQVLSISKPKLDHRGQMFAIIQTPNPSYVPPIFNFSQNKI